MSQWKLLAARRRGRRDAEAGVYLAQEFVDELLGPSPSWDPLGTHAPLAETMARAGELIEYRAIVHKEQGRAERAHAFPRFLYLVGCGFFLGVEALAMVGLLRDLGEGQASRLPLALMLAAFAVWVTHAMMDAWRSRTPDGGLRSLARALAGTAGFSLFALSVAFLRLQEWGVHETATLLDAVFWTAATLGPALLAEALFARYVAATVPRNITRTFGRERKRLERQVARALGQRAAALRLSSPVIGWESFHLCIYDASRLGWNPGPQERIKT